MWFTVMIAILGVTACVQAPPRTAAQELDRHRWTVQSSGHDKSFGGSLSFEGGRLTLETVTGSRENTLSGEYTADDKTITVLTDAGETLTMNYKMQDNRLILGFSGKEVTFVKGSTVTNNPVTSK